MVKTGEVIFVGDIRLEIVSKNNAKGKVINDFDLLPTLEQAILYAPEDRVLDYLQQLIRKGEDGMLRKLYVVVDDRQLFLNRFYKYVKLISAAGGIVQKNDQVLVIHRLGRWDLPKGKVEKNESIELAAVREVEEECGVVAMLGDKVGCTYHTYVHNENLVLKTTHWFDMICKSDDNLKAQAEEGIEEVKWIDKKVFKRLMDDSYDSIKYLTKEIWDK